MVGGWGTKPQTTRSIRTEAIKGCQSLLNPASTAAALHVTPPLSVALLLFLSARIRAPRSSQHNNSQFQQLQQLGPLHGSSGSGLHNSTDLNLYFKPRRAPLIPSASASLSNSVHKLQCHGYCAWVLFVYIFGAGGIMFQQHSCGKEKIPFVKNKSRIPEAPLKPRYVMIAYSLVDLDQLLWLIILFYHIHDKFSKTILRVCTEKCGLLTCCW